MDPKTFSGPFVTVLAFAQWMVPLLVAELYFKRDGLTLMLRQQDLAKTVRKVLDEK